MHEILVFFFFMLSFFLLGGSIFIGIPREGSICTSWWTLKQIQDEQVFFSAMPNKINRTSSNDLLVAWTLEEAQATSSPTLQKLATQACVAVGVATHTEIWTNMTLKLPHWQVLHLQSTWKASWRKHVSFLKPPSLTNILKYCPW